MDIALWILIGLVVVALALTFRKGRAPLLLEGFKQAGRTLKSMWLRLLLGLTLGGLIQVIVPSSLIAEWLGPTSGLKGILIASYAGIIMTGGPYVTLPIIASIYAGGAGPGPVIALLASNNTVSLTMYIAWETPFLGAKIATTRYLICLFIPPVVGILGASIYRLLSGV